MNILFFNRSFYPDLEATGQFLTELCEDLKKYGHNVTVIAGKSYHVKDKKKSFIVTHDEYKSISILRVLGTSFPKRFLLFRLINLGFYFLFAFIAGFCVKNKPDVVVAQTDPPVMGLLGYFFSKWYKAKFIYSYKDIYPEIGIVTGRLRNPLLNFLLDKINRFSCKNADKIICLGEDMKKIILVKNENPEKIEIVYDWADTDVLHPVPANENLFRKKYDLDNKFLIMYSGNIGLTQGLEDIVKVADRLKENEDIQFLLVGEGASKKKLQDDVNRLVLSNVVFLPYQPKKELSHSLSAPNLHLITLQQGLAGLVVPSKVYGILSCGRPFIAWIEEKSEIFNIVSKYNCGIVVPPGNIEKMVEAILWAVSHPDKLEKMGVNSRNAALNNFDRRVSTAKFNKIISEVKN